MEVDLALFSLFMLSLTVCAGVRPLVVNCSGCTCVSSDGVTLWLGDIFDDSVRKTYNKSSYCFPSCLHNSSCGNNTSGLVCVSKDSVQHCRNSGIVCIQPELTSSTSYTEQPGINDNTAQCNVTISCSPPPAQQLDDTVVFYVSNCGKLKDFVLFATVDFSTTRSMSSRSLFAESASTAVVTSMPSLSTPMMTNTTSTSSSSVTSAMTPLSTVTLSTSDVVNTTAMPSSSITPSVSSMTSSLPTVVPPSHPHTTTDDSHAYRLLYIIIPTVAPAAFIIAFITVFCLLNWCHQRNKKKLYIKLTSTIYSEDDSSDDSDN